LKRIKLYSFILFLLAADLSLAAVPDSLIYRIREENHGLSVNFNGLNFSFIFRDNNRGKWVCRFSDNYKYALKNYDDSQWKNLNSDFQSPKADSSRSKGLPGFVCIIKSRRNLWDMFL
jgi:hypothetical protein